MFMNHFPGRGRSFCLRARHPYGLMSTFLPELQSGIECRSAPNSATKRRISQAPPACRLRGGDDWLVADRLLPANPHRAALLARHSLEPALTREPASTEPLLVVILGPTAGGKTALSLALAERFHGEIVNCDSVAMYREFEIGTAKPNAAERARAPHHLLDFIEPTNYITAGEYARHARQVLTEISSRSNLPIVAGGTGLYLRALLEGLFPGPQRSEELRERLREQSARRGSNYLYKILNRLDPAAARRIHANDTPKLIRAIEVCLASREKMSDLWRSRARDPLRGFHILRIGLDPERQALYARINDRARQMFERGLLEETRKLIEKYGPAARALSSLGYKQAGQFLNGELTRQQAVNATQQAHRNYAKRQMTWFRREPDVQWLTGFGDDARIQREAVALVQNRSV